MATESKDAWYMCTLCMLYCEHMHAPSIAVHVFKCIAETEVLLAMQGSYNCKTGWHQHTRGWVYSQRVFMITLVNIEMKYNGNAKLFHCLILSAIAEQESYSCILGIV